MKHSDCSLTAVLQDPATELLPVSAAWTARTTLGELVGR